MNFAIGRCFAFDFRYLSNAPIRPAERPPRLLGCECEAFVLRPKNERGPKPELGIELPDVFEESRAIIPDGGDWNDHSYRNFSDQILFGTDDKEVLLLRRQRRIRDGSIRRAGRCVRRKWEHSSPRRASSSPNNISTFAGRPYSRPACVACQVAASGSLMPWVPRSIRPARRASMPGSVTVTSYQPCSFAVGQFATALPRFATVTVRAAAAV